MIFRSLDGSVFVGIRSDIGQANCGCGKNCSTHRLSELYFSFSKNITQTFASIKLRDVQSSILLHDQKCSIDNKQRWVF